MDRKLAFASMVAAGLVGLSGPAAAFVVQPAPVVAGTQPDRCSQLSPPPVGVARFEQAPRLDKSSAILGGQVSALDRIRQAQQGAAASALQQVSLQAAAAAPRGLDNAGLVPGVGAIACNRFSLPKAAAPIGTGRAANSEDFLLTRRLSVGHTAFDAEWSRVSNAGLSARAVQQMVPRQFRSGAAGFAAIQGINAWANHRIRYAEDAALYGQADHWANAASTLRRRAGDCEDIAIVKMQVLAAMGVPRSDMFLTIARDLARHADHALLVVRLDDRHWVLDNAADQLLDANTNLDYQPVLSFSGEHKWLHGSVTLALN